MLRVLALFFLLAPFSAFAQHLFSFGIKGGVPFTDAFSTQTGNAVDVVTKTFSNPGFVIGPMAELNLPLGFSVEADALFRPLAITTQTQVIPRTTVTTVSTDVTSVEIPVLGKYHFLHLPVIKPYIEAGPIFRVVGSRASYLSKDGFAFGGGVDIKLFVVRLEPEIRYERWGSDATITNALTNPPSNLNQAEFLVGLTF